MFPSSIPTFIVNLKHRKDRRESILEAFSGKSEFLIKLIEPIPHELPTVSLWQTLVSIIQLNLEEEVILICEDDHQFTENYSKEILFNSLREVQRLGGDMLLGGVSCSKSTFYVNERLYWVEDFTGLQFVVLFRDFFTTLLNAEFSATSDADIVISNLTDKKFLIYPFISVQKEFGYSDITPKNNRSGHVDELFKKSLESVRALNDLDNHFQTLCLVPEEEINYENIFIPTYVINLTERLDRLAHIGRQFQDRPEFNMHIVPAIKHEKGNLGLWLTIRKIVEAAISNDDDLILICEDDHLFTEHYDRSAFLKNIVEAHYQGVELILGGIGAFGNAIMTSKTRFWVSSFYCTQFTVIYKSIFKLILDEPIDEKITADGFFSAMVINKMVLFPFVSVQKLVGNSDINNRNSVPGYMDILFNETSKKLRKIEQARMRYSNIF